MLDERQVWINGDFVPWNQATVHMMCHSFARGSTIFEVISFYATAAGGPAVFRLHEHIARLERSAAHLAMELPGDHEALCRAVAETVHRNRLAQGTVKLVGYYPQVALDIQPPQKRLDVAVFALDPSRDLAGLEFSFERGTTAGIARWRKLDPQSVPIEAKAAANYLNGMVAKLDVQKRGFEDAILLDTQGFIAEGATESVFLVKEGRLLTPSLGTVLDSITRRSILQVARHLGIETFEGRLRPELLFAAQEIFFANTPFKVIPVRRIEERAMPAVPGPVQLKLAGFLGRVARGEEEAFKEWLYPVAA
ncbi:MAG: aminotransferase class IV [Desulfobacterales bacterium]|jgi:branched-chain amino acid aminotransferase|nr:aminotransferase class IV [Desulfobacterales bacterium]